MASMSTQIPNSFNPSSSKSPHHKYDVFLSFRGADVRDNFLENLYRALCQKSILTFKDDDKLEDGERINDGLLKAIEESKFAIVVLSKNYADSSWCLRELVHILKCKKDNGLVVNPIFYRVSPSDVRGQKRSFGEAFAKLTGSNEDEVIIWRKALKEVGELKGWAYPNDKFKTEASLIDDLVGTIFNKSIGTYGVLAEDLVGIKCRMKQVIELLNLGSDETRVVGLWGMGGIGKTTLATAVYVSISRQFEGCSFIENVREDFARSGSVLTLLETLISDILGEKDFKASSIIQATNIIQEKVCRKKVLIVLDDVNESNQVEDLVKKLHRFGRGCRIIITTRDEHVLKVCKAQAIFNVQGLNTPEAIQLFKSKAFAENEETKEFQRLIYDAVEYAKGVPLALQVLGSFLLGGTVPEWKSALKRVRKSPDDAVQGVLKVSYDGLQRTEKEVFLDIACFFTGGNKYGICKDRVINILDSCGFDPVTEIKVLVKKSLLTISEDNYLQMHDLVQQMGRSIVDEKSREEPGERSRLWHHEVIKNVLEENKGTNKVKGISYRDSEKIQLRPDAFAKMIDLRFLEVHATFCSIELPNNLRCLIWNEYPLRSMPSTFQPKHLVELHLTSSCINEQLWDTTMELPKLTGMNLSFSMSLINSPEFTSFPNLEYLDLKYCRALVNLHPSIGKLKNLQRLNLNGCESLQTFPDGIISGLCQLQELYMGNIPIDWERGENKQGRNASLREFESLSHLHTLHIQIKDPIALTGSLLFRNLKKYKIQIGDGYVAFGSYDKCCSIHLSMPVPLKGNIKFLKKNSQELRFRGEFTKDLVHGLVQDGSRNDIDSLEYLANAEATLLLPESKEQDNLKQLSVATGFVHLNKLVIGNCKCMEEVIWKDHKEDETNKLPFPKLQELEIEDLPRLVSFCRGIDEVEFPQLKSMSLKSLPKVQCLFSGFSDQSFFPHKVSFPSMKYIQLYDMENMKEIWCGQLQSGSFCNLTSLKVNRCDKLRAVFTPSQARYLLHLQTLTICECSLLEVVVAKEEEEDGVGDTTLNLPKLETVKLNHLPSLECFCHGAHDLEYPMLSDLEVIECPQLKTFSPGSVRTPKLNNVRLTKKYAEKQVTIWEDNLNSTIAHLHKPYQLGFQSLERIEVSDMNTLENLANAEASSLLFTTLEKLSLENLDNLKQLSHRTLVVIVQRFKNLTRLCVSKCNQLKNLFPVSVATEFMQLEKLVIKDCKSMEVVIHDEDETNKLAFPKLKELEIWDLPSLVSFCRGIDEVEFHQLERISLMNLPKVECLFSGLSNPSFFPHKVSFPSMKYIQLYDMENMKEIWCGQLQSGSFCNLTSLKVNRCDKLRAVFTPSQARYLLHLQTLTICECSLLEVVVAKEEEEDGVGDTTLNLPKLETVKLNHLPSLECFCHGAHDLEYPMLSDLEVIECPQLKTFSPGSVRTPKLNNVRLTKKYAEKQVTIWEDNLNSTIAHLHKPYQLGFQSLERIEVSDMNTLENLANAEASSLLFTTLEKLSLENLDNLKQLSHRTLVVIVQRFKNLTRLCVSKCNQLKNLFPVSVATEFMQLEKLVIKDCKSMEVVIHDEDETNKLAFPKLKELEIWDLPSLVSFCRGIDEVEFHQLERISLMNLPKVECLFSGLSNPSFFPHKVSFPSMKYIQLYDMENMKEIWCGQLQSGSFCNLTSLKVNRCDKLRAVFTPSQARYLLHLQTLTIRGCSLLEVVVAKEEEEDGVGDTTLNLPKLETVELNHLPSLECFCHGAHDLEYPMLSDLEVIECPQLKTFSPGSVRTPKLNNVRLTKKYAEKQVTIWEDNLNSTIAHLHKPYQLGFQSLERFEVSDMNTLENLANAEASSLLFTTLEKLSLENLDNLKQLSHRTLVVIVQRFKNLTRLCVSKCNQLKNLFLVSVATEFMQLEKLVIKDCKSMEVVIHNEDETNKLAFPKLKELEIDDLPSLVSFCRGIDEVEFHQLERISLRKLPNVECLFSGLSNPFFFPHKVSFPSMKEISLYNREKMQEIWCGQLQSGPLCNVTTLKVEHCHKLRAVFTPSQARYLLHLQTLTIDECYLLKVVVAKEEEEDGVGDTTLLPKLETVKLNHLPSLECFCHVAHDLEYPMLSDLKVIDCPQLKTFSPGFVRTPKLHNVTLTNWYFLKKVTIWEGNLNSTISYLHKQYQFGSRNLVHFEVSDMNTLENLANVEASSFLFTTLKSLSLGNMDNLQQLSHSTLVVMVRRFKNLTDLCVSKCHQLKNLFLLSVATEFMHLKKIIIKDCKNMEEVIGKEHREDETNKLVFPKLEWLIIDDLPSLVSFCRGIDEVEFPELERMSLKKLPKVESLFSGISNQSFFPHKVSFPSLKFISLEDMVNMKEIWCGQLQSNLTHLFVEGCDKLRAVFRPSAARYLVHLEYLFIKDCSLLEIVVAKEEEEDGVEDTTLLPELKTVELNELPALESFCHVKHDLEYPKLSFIHVINCPELKTFSLGFVRTPELNNVSLTEEDAEKQVTIWEDNLNSTIEHLHKQNQEEQPQHEDGIEEENIEG